MKHVLIIAIFWSMASCSGSDFAGSSGKNSGGKAAKKDDDGDDGNEAADDGPLETDADGDTTSGGKDGDDDTSDGSEGTESGDDFDDISTDTGTIRCDIVKDPNATADLGSNADLRNGGRLAINQFVNEKCQAKPGNASVTSAAGVVGTAETALTICRLMGYKTVRSSVTQSFTSAGDNQIASWDAGTKKFTIIPASQNNVWFGFIQCAEKLETKCTKDVKVTCG